MLVAAISSVESTSCIYSTREVCTLYFIINVRSFAIIQKTDNQFVYDGDNKGRGIVYWMGTLFGEQSWSNPAKRGFIRLESSGWSLGCVDDIVGRKAVYSYSKHKEGAWVTIDFGLQCEIKPTAYSLSHSVGHHGWFLRDWVFEGSTDGGQHWIVIKRHENDRSLKEKGQSHAWQIPQGRRERGGGLVVGIEGAKEMVVRRLCTNKDKFYNQFRIRMTGPNSNDDWHLLGHALEIYGTVINNCSIHPRFQPAAQEKRVQHFNEIHRDAEMRSLANHTRHVLFDY